MSEHRLFLNADECAAIRAGRKTQFRREIEPQPHIDKCGNFCWNGGNFGQDINGRPLAKSIASPVPDSKTGKVHCPFGAPGDRLWVPEGWAYHAQAMSAANDAAGPFVYRADGDGQAKLCDRWRAPVSMPRFAARIVLEVVSVRVERLANITISDAIREGYDGSLSTPIDPSIEWVAQRWESIHGAGSWNKNPWVWVVEFKPISSGDQRNDS